MRICFLATADSIHAYRWIRYFALRGHDVHWLSLAPSRFPEIEGVTFRRVGGNGPWWSRLITAALHVRAHVSATRPDLVHAHYLGSYGALGMVSGHPVLVGTAWGSDILFAGKSAVKRPIVRAILRRCALLTTDAHHMIDAMVNLGAVRDRIRLILFGIDTDVFAPREPDAALRETLAVGSGPVVVSLRRLEPVYDIDTLIQATRILVDRGVAAHVVVVGDGSQAGHLKALAERLGVADRIRFTGAVSNDEMWKYLALADVYVSTSRSDAGLSSSTAEAMSCEVPVVISRSAENDMWVDGIRSGLLFDVGSADQLADQLSVLLADSSCRKAMGRAGREVIVERLNYEREMRKMEVLYSEISGAADAPGGVRA